MLSAVGLQKSFGSLAVTQDVTLELPAGCRHALIGPNGAGKTTFFDLLTGEVKADAGQVFLDGVEITHASPDARARAGIARSFQRNNLFSELSVRENLIIASVLKLGIGHVCWRSVAAYSVVAKTVEASAERLGLADALETPARHLSYGTQRQLEIGLALERDPKVLLLDEPTSGMSPEETGAMQALLKRLPAELTVLIIEHDMDVVFEVADSITVLDYGRVLIAGDRHTVRNSEEVRQRYLGEAF